MLPLRREQTGVRLRAQCPPDSLHSRWPAGRSAQLPPSDVWSPARRHVLHHVGSANIATSHVGHPGPVRLLVRPATALRDDATVLWLARPAAASRRRMFPRVPWLGPPVPRGPEFPPPAPSAP